MAPAFCPPLEYHMDLLDRYKSHLIGIEPLCLLSCGSGLINRCIVEKASDTLWMVMTRNTDIFKHLIKIFDPVLPYEVTNADTRRYWKVLKNVKIIWFSLCFSVAFWVVLALYHDLSLRKEDKWYIRLR